MKARVLWTYCWAANAIHGALPWPIQKHCGFLLPAAGAYAFSETFEDFKRTKYFQ
jgi:hypothetical protein